MYFGLPVFRNSRVCVSQLELSFWTMIDTKDLDLHHSIPIYFIYQVLLVINRI